MGGGDGAALENTNFHAAGNFPLNYFQTTHSYAEKNSLAETIDWRGWRVTLMRISQKI